MKLHNQNIRKSAVPLKLCDDFHNYLNYLRMKGLKDHTIGEHRRFLFGALSHSGIANKKIQDLKLTDVANVIEAGRAHGEYGSQRAVITFRQYLRYLQENGVRLPFDWRDIKVPKVPEKEPPYMGVKEFNSFVKGIPLNNICGLRTRALIEVLFASGMRISEALSLNKEDIDWAKKEAKIKGAKGGDERIVYFTDRSLRWLKRYLKARKDDCPALFANQAGTGAMKRATARNYLRKIRKEMGIKEHFTHHSFRRALATVLIEKGADIKSTQHIMGHKSERTTLRYYAKVNKRKAKLVHRRLLSQI